jgi:hypothetical protein
MGINVKGYLLATEAAWRELVVIVQIRVERCHHIPSGSGAGPAELPSTRSLPRPATSPATAWAQANPVIFCGDLNDEPPAATTQIIQGPGGSEIDFRPGSGFRTGDCGDGYRMWNLYRLLPSEGPNYSRIYRAGANPSSTYSPPRPVNPDNLPSSRRLCRR